MVETYNSENIPQPPFATLRIRIDEESKMRMTSGPEGIGYSSGPVSFYANATAPLGGLNQATVDLTG